MYGTYMCYIYIWQAQHELYLMKTWNIPCTAPSQLPHPSRLQTYSHQSSQTLQSMVPQTPLNAFRAEQHQQQPHHLQQQQQQPSIYPSSFTPHECDANLKSDFVKYLSHINQFPASYDKNNFADNTLPINQFNHTPYSHLYPNQSENLLQNHGTTAVAANLGSKNDWNSSFLRLPNKYDDSIINVSAAAATPTTYGNLYNENCIIEDDNQLYGQRRKNQQNVPLQTYQQRNIQIIPPPSSIAGSWNNSGTYLAQANQNIYGNEQNQQQQFRAHELFSG